MNIVGKEVDAELTEGRYVGLDVDRIGIDVACDLRRWQQVARLQMPFIVTLRLYVESIEVVADAVARDERDVLREVCRKRYGVSVVESISVLVVEVD